MNNSAGAASIAGEAIGEVQRQSRNRVADLERQLAENGRAMADLQRGYDAGLARMIGQRVDAMRDPRTGIELIYQRQRAALEGDPDLQRNTKLLAAKLAALADARDRELEAVKASTRAQKHDAETLTANQVAKLLRGDLPGVQITSTTGGKHVKNSYHYRNQAVDFVPAGGMGSMTKDDVRRIFESRGIEIVELLGPGDKNHNDHFHVAWTKGKLSLDAFTDAAKRAKEEAEELTSLRLFTDGNALGQSLAGVRGIIAAQSDQFNQSARSILGISGDPLSGVLGSAGVERRVEVDRWNEENARRVRQQEEDFRYLGNLWSTVLNGGTRGVWDMFRQQGLQVISELLARWMAFGTVKGAGGAAGSFLSAFGTLFGGGVNVGAARAGANAALDAVVIPRFAVGTHYSSAGAALVGENGPELVSLPRGSRVMPAAETRRMLAAGNDNRPQNVTNNYFQGVMTVEDFWQQIQQGNDSAAVRGAAGGSAIGQAEMRAQGTRRLGRRW